MFGRVYKGVRSVGRSLWIALSQGAKCSAALARGDREAAGGYARIIYLNVHEDLLKLVTAVQARIPPWRRRPEGVDRILIVKLDRIGDMVTTTPVFDALRELYPDARIDIVGHPLSLSLLEGDDRINERFQYSSWLYQAQRVSLPGLRSLSLVFKLVRRRYPLVVYLRGSVPFLALGLVSRMAATKYVVAEPVIGRYMKAVRAVCGPVSDYPPRLYISPENAAFARSLLRGEGDPQWDAGPRIVIHASASSSVKMWPPERFAALADTLHLRFDARVHFLGSPADRPTLETVGRLASYRHAFHWSLRLPLSAAVIAGADVFIGNDSGLSHIAAAVGTRAVVLWGPANLPMARPQAPPEDCLILYHDVGCRNTCLEFRCHNPDQLECLMRTQVEDVLNAVARLLGKESAGRTALPLAPVATC